MKTVNNSTATRVVCAILFLSFTFVFLYCYEGDMLVIEQHIASDGMTHYEYLIGAVLLAAFLFLVQLAAAALTRLHGIFHAITYFPSLLILTLLTDTPLTVMEEPTHNGWMWQLPLMLVLWTIAVWLARRYQSVEVETRHVGLFTQLTFINVLTLTMLMLIPCLLGNHDRDFHRRIHQEYLITHGRYDEALREGLQASVHDHHQTMVNAYCLFKQNTLADSLFTLPMPHDMTSLLPNQANGHFYLLADTTLEQTAGHHRDALLCNRLLARQLPQFATRLHKWYGRKNLFPKHFTEAVALCRELHPATVADYPANQTDTLLMDFQRLRLAHEQDSLHALYGHTYWYYFYRKK